MVRMVRAVFQVSGFLVMDARGQQIIQIVLNQAAPLASPLVSSLHRLLAPAHSAVQLGKMEKWQRCQIVGETCPSCWSSL